MNKIAIAMSVYNGDSAEHLKNSIQSMLNQVEVNIVIFIEVDGKINSNLQSVLSFYENKKNIIISYHKENMGLAYRLNSIIDKVVLYDSFLYLARMDADDISDKFRLKIQSDFLEKNPKIDIVGSDVIEFYTNGKKYYKNMESNHEAMEKNIIKKCPLNHPSVLFRTDLFKQGFRYNSKLTNTQDYYLWIDLLVANKKFSNINKPLLYFRVNSNFYSRRGINKAINDLKSRIYAMKKLNICNLNNIFFTILLFTMRISPIFIKKLTYKYLR